MWVNWNSFIQISLVCEIMSQNDLNNTDKQELKVVIVGDGAVRPYKTK